MQKRIFEEREIERQSYMSQVLKAHEDERKHIARELHDDAIQTLIALANRMQSLLNKEANKLSEPAVQQLEQFRDSVFDLSKDLRRLSVELRSSILDDVCCIIK